MRLRLLPFIILVSIGYLPVSGQSTSCLDPFRGFSVLEPEVNTTVRNEIYEPTMAWYGQCILIGSSDGLWLYDPYRPDNVVQLAQIEDRAIANVAVNPESQTIAFNVAQEPTVYLIDSDAKVSFLTSSGQAVTAISFSPDGSLMAVASSEIVDFDGGFYYDARVQIWNSEKELDSTVVNNVPFVPDVFFASNNRHILTHDVNPGYFGDEVRYWEIYSASTIWSYSDLLRDLQPFSANDPLIVSSVTMRGDVVAFGGVDGYYNDRNFNGLAVHLWNAETQHRQLEIRIRNPYGKETVYILPRLILALDRTASVLATSTGEDTIQLWDRNSGNQIGEFFLQASLIRQIAFRQDSPYLAVLTETSVMLFNYESLEEIVSFELSTPTSDSE